MIWTNKNNLPEAVAAVLRWDTYQKRGDFSASELPRPARALALERAHEGELMMDVTDATYSRIGTGFALLAERKMKRENVLSEEGLSATMTVDGVTYTVTGRPDLYEEDGTITDWKVSSTWAITLGEDHADWDGQLWIYEWLFRRNGFSVGGLRNIILFRDWSRSKAASGNGYPPASVHVRPVQSPPLSVIEGYIEGRIREHVAARNGRLPECRDSERWARPATFAVMKPGRKTALRVFDTKDEALSYMGQEKQSGLELVERKGEDVRCEHYCLARPWCTQAGAKGR